MRALQTSFDLARNVGFDEGGGTPWPLLPGAEADGLHGVDLLLTDLESGDVTSEQGSPAAGRGHTAPLER